MHNGVCDRTKPVTEFAHMWEIKLNSSGILNKNLAKNLFTLYVSRYFLYRAIEYSSESSKTSKHENFNIIQNSCIKDRFLNLLFHFIP